MLPWLEDGKLYEVVRLIDPDCGELTVDSLNWVKERLTLWRLKSDITGYLDEIETTLTLINSLIKESQCQQDVSSTDCWDLCAQYSIVIIKFCNLLSYYKYDDDSEQIVRRPNKVKKSIRDLGINLQIPSWVLDCRHRICHASVNSLSVLRQASAFVRSWIYHHFWSLMVIEEDDYDLDTAIKSDIEALFTTPISRKRKKILQRLEKNCRSHRDKTCPHIAEFLVDSTFHRFKNAKINDLENSRDILIFYSRILRVIETVEDFEELLKSMALFMEPNSPKLTVAVEWFKIFVKTLGTSKENRHIRRCLRLPSLLKDEEDTEILWLRLLYIAAKSPNRYTPELIDYITSLMPNSLSTVQVSKLKKAARCFLFPLNETKFDSENIKTLDNFETPDFSLSSETLDVDHL